MKINNNISSFFLILLIVTLMSCDPLTSDSYIINNQSKFEINIFYKSGIKDSSIVVGKNSNQEFFNSGQTYGYAEDYGIDFLKFFDTLHIEPGDTIVKLLKDPTMRKNWEFERSGRISTVGKYVFNITNDDIK